MKNKQPIVVIGHQFTSDSNYLPRVLDVLARGKFRPGEGDRIRISHDGWCAFYNGWGPCNCNPVVRVERLPES